MNVVYRFIDKIEIDSSNGCWNWVSFKTKLGYGWFSYNGKPEYAHRVSYKLFIGYIPDGLCVCHLCDNPSCVNPKHLYLGTRHDNIKDRDCKGRGRYKRHLSWNDIHDIRCSDKSEHGYMSRLAEKYNVTRGCICHIINNKRWKE